MNTNLTNAATKHPAFSIRGLEKSYDDFHLGPLNLSLDPGSVLAFIGPNGSGKTTTLACMVGMILPDAGTVEIFGLPNIDADIAWKHEIGYVGETQGFYLGWSGAKNLRFLSRFYPRWSESRVAELARRFDLPLEKKVRNLSKGGKAKLALLAALGHSPRLLLLDEPTSGLDPVVRAEVLDVLWEILEDGETSIFYSTHVLSDISRLADELVFLRQGNILSHSSRDALEEDWRRISFRLPQAPSGLSGAVRLKSSGGEHQVISSKHDTSQRELRALGAESIDTARMSIEEIAVEILKGA
jgi:ABC-2 type transport system ATP-binding protein